MLQTLSDCYEICYNPLNTSVSKQLFSMPRSRRFSSIKLNCEKSSYNLPEVLNQRATGLGFGTKTDFSKLAPVTPAPNRYRSNTIFDLKHGYTFKSNREIYNDGLFICQLVKQLQQAKCGSVFQRNSNPSPQHYSANPTSLSKMSYSIRHQTVNPEERYSNRKSPGPGTYNDASMRLSSQGRYLNSLIRDTGYGGLINPEQRGSTARLSPGPGHYKEVDRLSSDGSYYNSKFLSGSRQKFSRSERQPMRNISYGPGPGGYKKPSDFGQYGSSIVYSPRSGSRDSKNIHNSSYLGYDFMRRNPKNLSRSLMSGMGATSRSIDKLTLSQEYYSPNSSVMSKSRQQRH